MPISVAQDLTSSASISPDTSSNDDWDRSVSMQEASTLSTSTSEPAQSRNSIAFPSVTDVVTTVSQHWESSKIDGKRSLSELLKRHAEKGTDVTFSQDEAQRLADVLGRWINASSSPYEAEDDDLLHSQDDISVMPRPSLVSSNARPRGRSECVNQRTQNLSSST